MTRYSHTNPSTGKAGRSKFPAAKGGKTRTNHDIPATKPDIDRTKGDKNPWGSTLKCHEMSPFVAYFRPHHRTVYGR